MLGAVALVAAISLSACGSSDWRNKDRPPGAIEVTARIDPEKVEVSPDKFGAGVVNFTIANLSRAPVRFTLSGPKDAATPKIEPETPTTLQLALRQGRYRAAAEGNAAIRPASVTVGPERSSSQNKLLQP